MSHTLPKICFWQGVNNRKNIEYEIYFIHHYVNEIRIPAISRIYIGMYLYFGLFMYRKTKLKMHTCMKNYFSHVLVIILR